MILGTLLTVFNELRLDIIIIKEDPNPQIVLMCMDIDHRPIVVLFYLNYTAKAIILVILNLLTRNISYRSISTKSQQVLMCIVIVTYSNYLFFMFIGNDLQ